MSFTRSPRHPRLLLRTSSAIMWSFVARQQRSLWDLVLSWALSALRFNSMVLLLASSKEILDTRDSTIFRLQLAIDPIHDRLTVTPDFQHQLLVLRQHLKYKGSKSLGFFVFAPPPFSVLFSAACLVAASRPTASLRSGPNQSFLSVSHCTPLLWKPNFCFPVAMPDALLFHPESNVVPS